MTFNFKLQNSNSILQSRTNRTRNPGKRVRTLLIFGRDSVLLLHPSDLLLLLFLVEFLAHLGLLVVEHDEVTVGDVEARKVIDGGLGIIDIFVDHEGRTARVFVRPDSYLPNRSVLAEYVVHLLARDVERKVTNVKHTVYLRWKTGVPLPETDRRHWRLGFWVFGEQENQRERERLF